MGFPARSHFPVGLLGQGPSRCPPAFGARLPACRGEEGAFGTPAWTARCPTPQPSESAEHCAKKTAARAAEAARRGGERGAAGAGTAPALSAAHLPTPGRCPRGRSLGVPGLVSELRDFPYRRRGIVQGPGKLPAQVAVAFVLVENGFEAIADQPG